MERPVKIDEKIIKRQTDVNPFALDKVRVETGGFFEYLIEGIWTPDNPGIRPEGTRTVFKDVARFRAAKDVYFAWEYLESLRTQNPVYPEEIINRLIQSRLSQSPLTIFIPWGVRPEGEPKMEDFVMDRIQSFSNRLNLFGINTQILIMPADLYATEVNNIDPGLAENYFSEISRRAMARGFTVKPWSEIRSENYDDYQRLSSMLTRDEIEKILYEEYIFTVMQTARRRSGYTEKEDIVEAALRYLRERICEAIIVEEKYSPIKFSLVSKGKDNEVDMDLPRIYAIPEELQFPWLK